MNKDQAVALVAGAAKIIGTVLVLRGATAAAAIVTNGDVIESVAGLVITIVSFISSHRYNATPAEPAQPIKPT